ncbi:transmembrane and ubiquitin-like domain-containing protein 1 [Diorhabda carinulata]|uniref:transmembrane and ubiquitin-like domain-containing protein 1 n=1 Tax=Diorhabda sublineata TaxID=1163346 RepID=UPI0024E0F928|nr:transmembrane and ubiquitin-like domain-containing protein 1 [Diorhabda sublineata]XP_057669472.1 transmembrane and ubiquitin-like domain-containing protein 1 [Diorhabda carinulata]
MTIIEGIGDEVTHFFIALFVVVIGTAAWWTTNISEQRPVRAVLWFERRRHRAHRRLTNHIESVTITEGSNNSVQVEEEQSQIDATTETQTALDQSSNANKPPESNSEDNLIPTQSTTLEEPLNQEQNIIDTMDADANIVRQRRLAFYGGFNNDDNQQGATSSHSTLPNQNPQTSSEELTPSAPPSEESAPPAEHVHDGNNAGITIKLKYINDDLKLVEGNLNESLEEFKKRHFLPELSANKIIRLIFNGQVLQPDSQTLKNCGLFDNCVVHCLIHQKRNPPTDPNVTESRREGYSFPSPSGLSNNNNNQNREWDLGNFLFAFISLILLAAWYFRYVYAHLYTVTATVGLILITGIFTIVLVGMYFPDNEQSPTITFHLRERAAQQTE